jgi:rhamnosyl/mannosyltransferase
MKILQIAKYYPPHRGGMETAVRNICETISPHAEITVVAAGERRGARREVVHNIDVTRLSTWGTLFSQPLTAGVFSAIRNSDADLVHLHEPNPLAVAAYLLSGSRVPLVIHYHSDVVRQKRLRLLYWPLLRKAMEKATRIIVGSPHLIENSKMLSGFREKCSVIPFGIDLSKLRDLERDALKAAEVTILAVGRLIYYKGFEYLIEAMRDVAAKLVIVGEGPDRDRLERQIARCDVSDKVRLAGAVGEERLIEWYRQATVFCLPSCENSEAFGLVMAEAMAAGLPVVSTNLPTGVQMLNIHGETGIVVPPRDVAALGSALSLLAASPEARLQMGMAGRVRAIREFSREAMGRRILSLYRNVLHVPEAGPIPVWREVNPL